MHKLCIRRKVIARGKELIHNECNNYYFPNWHNNSCDCMLIIIVVSKEAMREPML